MKNNRVAGFAICCLLVNGALGQTTPPMRVATHHTPARKLLIVEPDGRVKKASDQTRLRLHSELLAEPEAVGEILRRNGLSDDQETVGMLKRLNPTHDFSSGSVPAGTKLVMFVPALPSANASSIPAEKRLTFDSSMVARWTVRDQVVRAQANQAAANKLSRRAFESPAVASTHLQAVSEIHTAAKVLEEKADSLSAQDLAVARYEIDYANRKAAQVNKIALETGRLTAEQAELLRKTTTPLQNMSLRLRSDQTPTPHRRVNVTVLRKENEEPVNGLQVYVIPAGFVDAPAEYDETEILEYLTCLSFEDETSPCKKDIPLCDIRVWVGPKMKFKEMAQLVQTGALTLFQPVADSELARVNLVFRAPDDIVAVQP